MQSRQPTGSIILPYAFPRSLTNFLDVSGTVDVGLQETAFRIFNKGRCSFLSSTHQGLNFIINYPS